MLLRLLLPREDWSPYAPGTKLGTYPCQSPGANVLLPGGSDRERSSASTQADLPAAKVWGHFLLHSALPKVQVLYLPLMIPFFLCPTPLHGRFIALFVV